MIHKTGLILLAFIFLFSFAGCDDEEDRNLPGNGQDLPDPGEFHAEISGDMERDSATGPLRFIRIFGHCPAFHTAGFSVNR